jgi:hypothetical protein
VQLIYTFGLLVQPNRAPVVTVQSTALTSYGNNEDVNEPPPLVLTGAA